MPISFQTGGVCIRSENLGRKRVPSHSEKWDGTVRPCRMGSAVPGG